VYAELRRLAHRYMRSERADHSLQTNVFRSAAPCHRASGGKADIRASCHQRF
jgi:hypothetical protein